jgi:hypothetical protein
MFATRFALVMAVALVVAGCSGGGGKHASPTTTIATTSSTAKTRTTVSPRHAVADLARCPRRYPPESLTVLNKGVRGLGVRLVPITALNVRICEYANGALVRSEILLPAIAIPFGQATNLLKSLTPHEPVVRCFAPQGPTGPTSSPASFVVTFASDSRQVTLSGGTDPCDGSFGLTNGIFNAATTGTWVTELEHYTIGSTVTGTVVGTLREVGGRPPGLNRQISGTVFALDTSGANWQATTTATRPFMLTLPAGTYGFGGNSPLVNSGQIDCFAPGPVVVVGGKTTQVEVVCSIR